MTKRKPLEWYSMTDGSDRLLPGCVTCADKMLEPMLAEAVCSVSIEHPGSPDDLMRRTLNQWHADRHRGLG